MATTLSLPASTIPAGHPSRSRRAPPPKSLQYDAAGDEAAAKDAPPPAAAKDAPPGAEEDARVPPAEEAPSAELAEAAMAVDDAPAEVATDAPCDTADSEAATTSPAMDMAAADGAHDGDGIVVVQLGPDDLERTKTIRELRDMCTRRGLPSHGRKLELVARLQAAA